MLRWLLAECRQTSPLGEASITLCVDQECFLLPRPGEPCPRLRNVVVDLVIGSEPCSLVEMGAARVSTTSLSETSAGCPDPKVTISPEPWRLVVMDPGRSRQWALTSIFSPSTFSRDERASDTIFGKALAKILQVSWSTSKSCSSEIPRVLSGLLLPTFQAPLSTLRVRASGPRRVDVQCFIPSTLGRKSLRASLGSLCFRTLVSFRDADWPCVGIFFL